MSKKESKTQVKTPAKPQLNSDNQLKEEIVKWMFTILFSATLYALVAYLISLNYHQDIQSLYEAISKMSFMGNPKPEPTESLLVKLGMVLIPAFMLTSYFFFNKLELIKKIANSSSFNYISTIIILIVAFIIYKDFAAPNPFAGAKAENIRDVECLTNYDFFFKGNFLGKHLILYTFIIVPLIYGLFIFGLKKNKWEDNRIYKFIFSVPGNLFVAGLVICIIVIHTFNFPYTYENKYDFNAVYYSMTQVYAGTPMLVDNFTTTYGLYPHFLVLIFKIIGLNIVNFTLVLSLLLGATFILNFFFLKHYVSNKIILFLGILSIITFPYIGAQFLLINFDASFSFWPIRWIIPSVLFCLTGLYLSRRSSKIYYLTFAVMGTFVLWNPEIGILCYMVWVFINVFNDFYDEAKKVNIKKMLFHIVMGALFLFVIFSIYKLAIYAFYGSSPDMGMLFTYMLLFGKTGFGSLPMALVHPWNIVSIIYMISILYVITKWLQKDITPKAVIILLVSVLGFGFFLYFQGRSHNFQFINATIPCFILLTIMGDMLWEKVKKTDLVAIHALFVILIYVISFSLFDIVTNPKKINEYLFQKNDKVKSRNEDDRIKSNANFVLKYTQPYEKIYVLTAWHYQAFYFNGSKRKSAFNPSILEMVLYSDLKRMEKNIIDSSFKVFFEPDFCNYHFMQRPIAAVAAKYEIVDGNISMGLLQPIKSKIPETEYFKADNSTFLHRKYTSDSTGIKARVDDSEGIKTLTLPQTFSLEVLFKPQQQVYKYATVVSNMTDSSGIMIANEKGTDKYYFGINGRSYIIPIVKKGWVYCVMDVFPDRVEIFQNGNLLSRFPLPQPYRNPDQKMCIGNIGSYRDYFGQIAEVSVSPKIQSNQDVQDRWMEIKKINE